MATEITASILYNLVQCPKRVELDQFGDAGARDPISPFVAMLWERGTRYEAEVVARSGLAFLDLSRAPAHEREHLTAEAMARGEPLIYGGRISAGDLVGVPDLLRREGRGYAPLDIKSGRGKAGGGGSDDDDEEGSPKRHYAVQLALYVDILERLGRSAGRYGTILDVRGREVRYDLGQGRGPRAKGSLWDEYQAVVAEAREIVSRARPTKGALASSCKLCHWHSACTAQLKADDDLTLIPVLGRVIRDAMAPTIPTVAALATVDPASFVEGGRTPFKGVREDRLRTFHARAVLLMTPGARPYLKAPIKLPASDIEFFFDIEVDPLRDVTYLHGIIERRGGDTASEKFFGYFTEDADPGAERRAFAQAVGHLRSEPGATIWYYSKYERTIYRKLQARYPDVCTAEDIEALFELGRAVDLYNDVVTRATEWPTHDQSIKTLAKYLGFAWRDKDPSGAASIEWFDRWVRERDPSMRQRILDYNEDDCRATRVLLDGIRALD